MNYITEQNYPAFKRAYQKAVEDQKQVFIFENMEVLSAYAYYVIEYVEGQTTKSKEK